MDYAFDPGGVPASIPRECIWAIGVTNGVLFPGGMISLAIELFQSMKKDDESNVGKGVLGSILLLGGVSILCCTAYLVGSLAKDCLKKKSYQELPDSTAQKV